jgi:hypothetical protein
MSLAALQLAAAADNLLASGASVAAPARRPHRARWLAWFAVGAAEGFLFAMSVASAHSMVAAAPLMVLVVLAVRSSFHQSRDVSAAPPYQVHQ